MLTFSLITFYYPLIEENMILAVLNPVKGNSSDSELNARGCQFDTTSEMIEGAPKDPMLRELL